MGSNAKILVVEDERIVSKDIETMLQTVGYTVVGSATNGVDAIQKAAEELPDLVLMDIGLKGDMDGIETSAELHKQIDVPVIFLTANSDETTLQRAKLSGPFGYILKPFELRELRTTIEVALYQHKIEKKLKENERWLGTTLTSIGDGVIAADVNGKVVFLNPVAESITGWKRAEATGKKISEVYSIYGEDKQPVIIDTIVTSALQEENNTAKHQYFLKSKEGKDVPIENSVSPIVDEVKKTRGSVIVFRDITEIKEAEERFKTANYELEEANLQLETTIEQTNRMAFETEIALLELDQVVNAVGDGLWVINKNYEIIRVNKTFELMTGIKKTDAIGKKCAEIFPSKDCQSNDCSIARIIKGENRVEKEIKLDNAEGNTMACLLTATPFRGIDGELLGIVETFKDITERKFLESQLMHAQKLESIGQLAAGIAHEINTPMQYINDNTHFLKDGFKDLQLIIEKYKMLHSAVETHPDYKNCAFDIKNKIEEVDLAFLLKEIPIALQQSLDGIARVTHIVQAMKEFSHPGLDVKKAVDINKAIETTLTVAHNEWKYIADIETNFDYSLPLVPCLPDEFNQVLLNIITNATHAIADVVGDGSNGKGKITITTRKNCDWAIINIRDTGKGIPEAIRTKVFDPFFTTKQVGKGTGQGLAISHSIIIEQHSGTLSFESEEGKGTTFTIQLPLEAKQEKP